MKTNYIYIGLVVLIIVGLVAVRNMGDDSRTERATKYDAFAQCLTDAGVKFYGAYWCEHCQAQKALFNNSTKLPYIECSTPNAQAQTQVCIDANVTGYPTWDFADGSRLDGERTLEELAEKTDCALPATS